MKPLALSIYFILKITAFISVQIQRWLPQAAGPPHWSPGHQGRPQDDVVHACGQDPERQGVQEGL